MISTMNLCRGLIFLMLGIKEEAGCWLEKVRDRDRKPFIELADIGPMFPLFKNDTSSRGQLVDAVKLTTGI